MAYNILLNNHDAEECVNDTLHKAWEAIPPKQPEYLGAYLSKITRNLSLKRWRAASAAKRGGSQADLMLSELGDIIPQTQTVESNFEYTQTVQAINTCLRQMDDTNRVVFIRRYFFGDSIQDLCQQFKASESKMKSILFRARQKLRAHLENEGVTL
ncbi:MAG: sigma-70 family RNA polymerase sigma factor [Defluviitaleaceae bacterium]|nr:sigma-70 family RNA polymerase sigma factor [Defluviitaleaceae bacterium]